MKIKEKLSAVIATEKVTKNVLSMVAEAMDMQPAKNVMETDLVIQNATNATAKDMNINMEILIIVPNVMETNT